jgi:hypothetical protein
VEVDARELELVKYICAGVVLNLDVIDPFGDKERRVENILDYRLLYCLSLIPCWAVQTLSNEHAVEWVVVIDAR